MKFIKHYRIELAETLVGHWYKVWELFDNAPEKYLGVFPSYTTILNAYPQSLQLMKWLADNGWNQSQLIKSQAGDSGTKIHSACDILEEGGTLLRMNYSLEEWIKVNSFAAFHNTFKPILIAKELVVFDEEIGAAGRLDRLYSIAGVITLLDFKSGSIYPHFPLQYAGYARAIEKMTNLKVEQTATLKLGADNKNGFRYITYENWRSHFKVFRHVQATWRYDFFECKKNKKEIPVIELPKELKLNQAKYESLSPGQAETGALSSNKGGKEKGNRNLRRGVLASKKKAKTGKGSGKTRIRGRAQSGVKVNKKRRTLVKTPKR